MTRSTPARLSASTAFWAEACGIGTLAKAQFCEVVATRNLSPTRIGSVLADVEYFQTDIPKSSWTASPSAPRNNLGPIQWIGCEPRWSVVVAWLTVLSAATSQTWY